MQNNLEILIKKAGLSKVQFGAITLKMPAHTKIDRQKITNKVNRYCKKDLKTIHTNLLDPFCEVLKCDYNTLYGYETRSEI